MDKAALRNFAMYARKKLIQDIKHKAAMLGITDEGIKSHYLRQMGICMFLILVLRSPIKSMGVI